jgi:hypothetical protein
MACRATRSISQSMVRGLENASPGEGEQQTTSRYLGWSFLETIKRPHHERTGDQCWRPRLSPAPQCRLGIIQTRRTGTPSTDRLEYLTPQSTIFMQKYAASSALTKNIFLLDILNKPYNPHLAAKHCRHLCYFCICLLYWHCMLRMRSYPFSLLYRLFIC